MDPNANLERQRELAQLILELTDSSPEEPDTFREHYEQHRELLLAVEEKAVELAALLVAQPRARVSTLVIRDPDCENEYVEETEGDVSVETIEMDLGSSFNGPKDFDADSDWGREWIEQAREEVKHLDPEGPIRQRVEELINFLTERSQG